MAVCEICQKRGHSGYNVSFSNRHTKRWWRPNLQRVTVYIEGRPRRVRACTRCIRSLYRER